MNWHIGQKVVCVNGHDSIEGLRLVKGQIYTIEGVSACKCSTMIYVGQKTEHSVLCRKCGIDMNDDKWWHYAERFAPIEEYEAHEKAVKQLLHEMSLEVFN